MLPKKIIHVLRQFEEILSERAKVLLIGAILAPRKRTMTSILKVMDNRTKSNFKTISMYRPFTVYLIQYQYQRTVHSLGEPLTPEQQQPMQHGAPPPQGLQRTVGRVASEASPYHGHPSDTSRA